MILNILDYTQLQLQGLPSNFQVQQLSARSGEKICDFKIENRLKLRSQGLESQVQGQAANCELSFQTFIHFVYFPPESQGGVVVHPSRIAHKFYLLLSSEIAIRGTSPCLSV